MSFHKGHDVLYRVKPVDRITKEKKQCAQSAAYLAEQLEDLAEGLTNISERQNSQFTDIMMQLKELKHAIHSGHAPQDNRTDDDLYDEAKEAVIEMGKASTSYIQRVLGVG